MIGGIARIFNWTDFEELTAPDGIQLLHPTHSQLGSPGNSLYYPIPGVGILEHRVASQSSSTQLILWPTTAFNGDSGTFSQPLGDDELEALGPIVHSILGIISGTRVVFLDTNLWICSFDLRLSPAAGVRGQSRSPGPFSDRSETPSPGQNMISYIRWHFFALSEWRGGGNNFSSLMVPSKDRSARNAGHNFAFVAGHRVVLVQGGLDFSETVTLGSSERVSRSEEVKANQTLTKYSANQQWTVVSGSMHRRSTNW